MKAFKYLLSAAMLAFAATASAQFANVGSSGGGMSNPLSIDTDNYSRFEVSFATNHIEDWDDDKPIGVSVGLIRGINITDKLPLFWESGINAIWTTRSIDAVFDDIKYNFLSLAVPMNLAYKLTFSSFPDFAIMPFVGLNFKFNILAKASADDEDVSLFDDYDEGGLEAKRFQLGMNVGAGFSYGSYYVGYHFQPDFMEFCEDTGSKSHFVTLGINF